MSRVFKDCRNVRFPSLPQSWLEREFQRQRSFPAFARSRQLVAKGQYEEAFQELETYLASDPEDLVIQFGYLILASDLKRHQAAIGAADRILARVPDFAPALFYRGLARAALGDNKEALRDLAAAKASAQCFGGEFGVPEEPPRLRLLWLLPSQGTAHVEG